MYLACMYLVSITSEWSSGNYNWKYNLGLYESVVLNFGSILLDQLLDCRFEYCTGFNVHILLRKIIPELYDFREEGFCKRC